MTPAGSRGASAVRRSVARGRRVTLPVAVVAALVLAILAPVGPLAAPVALGATTDLTLVTDATYTAQPESGRIGVVVAITARNQKPETRTHRFYFDHAFLAVQPGATNLRIVGVRGARVRAATRTKDATLLRIDFGARLYSGKAASYRLLFDLLGQGKAANPQVRVGSSLVTVPVWAFASDGARGSSVTVHFPAGWDVAVESGEFPGNRATGPGGTTLATGPLASPLTWFAYVSAQRPAVYVATRRTVAVRDREVPVLLQAWKDDHAWARRTGDLVARALPVLGEDIGIPWPASEPLVVQEAVNRDAGAAAGLFDPGENRIEVAYWANHGVVIHQAAHGWFNGRLLADRWANEGFATFYALRTSAALGETATVPRMTRQAKAAAQPLNAWVRGDGPATAADRYGYAASLALATDLANTVGTETLSRVWADLAGGVGAYQPPGSVPPATPEGVAGAADWRALLDLLEARSGQDLTALWLKRVMTAEQAPLIETRARARVVYERTVAVAGDWRLPRSIRDALRAWSFDAADALMADARAVLAQRNALAAMAVRDGVTLPGTMRAAFEEGSLAEAGAWAETERSTLDAIEAAASSSRSSDGDLLAAVGMIGEHPEQDLVGAKAALAAGDAGAATAAADRALRAGTAAWLEGRRRLLLAIAVLASIAVLGSAFAGNRRGSTRTPGGAVGIARRAGPAAGADDGPTAA